MSTLPFPFQRVVVAGTSSEFDADLVDYGAALASLNSGTELVVLSRTSRALQSFAVAPQSVLAAQRTAVAERLSCHVLVDPDVDSLFSTVDDLGADIVIVRPPKDDRRSRQTMRRIALESPCSVCVVPNASLPSYSRVVAGIRSDDSGADLLRAAANICKRVRSSELIVVRPWFAWTMDPSEAALDQLRENEWHNLFRFVKGVDLQRVDCTPQVEECSRFSTGVLRVAKERGADLIIIAAPERSWAWFPDRCPPEDLILQSPVPLLLLRSAEAGSGVLNFFRRMFSAPEPTFG